MATCLLILLAGLLAETQDGPTLVEQYFQLMEDPKFYQTRTTEITDDPPEMPELPEELCFERLWQTGQKCGPVALYFMLAMHGIDVSLDDVLARIPTNEKGTNLQVLQQTAEQFGLQTQAVRVTPENFGRLPHASIVHWNTPIRTGGAASHFDVFLRRFSDGDYQIIDTTSCVTKRMQQSVASQMMSGYALIAGPMVSRSSLGIWGISGLWTIFAAVLCGNAVFGGMCLRKLIRVA